MTGTIGSATRGPPAAEAVEEALEGEELEEADEHGDALPATSSPDTAMRVLPEDIARAAMADAPAAEAAALVRADRNIH